MTNGEAQLRRALADWICPERKREREVLEAELEQASAELQTLFHRLWGKAHEAASYEKKEWTRLAGLLQKFDVEV